jgi:uncharacterized protein DUF899
MGDELARQRRELPWVRVEKDYRFETDEGTRTLAELFDDRYQLLVYHFMFGPTYEASCPICSSIAHTIDTALPHVQARDATIVCVSRASLEKLQTYKRRMAGAFPGRHRLAPTSTSTSASRTPTSNCRAYGDRSSMASRRRHSARCGNNRDRRTRFSTARQRGATKATPPSCGSDGTTSTARRRRRRRRSGDGTYASTGGHGHCSRLTSCFAGVSERPGRARSRFRNGRGAGA